MDANVLPDRLCGIQMKVGQDNARQTDTHSLNSNIIKMMFHKASDRTALALSGLKDDEKSTCGFNHEATGNLLCPINLDWDDPA